jgi:hypothetical protein
MPSFLHLDGRARDVPRGCALSWSLAVLPALDPPFASAQWEAYRRHFGGCALGLCLFREYPRGIARGADSDSGPMVAGYGMAASAFALAAARAEGDAETAEGLRRFGELVSFPAVSWWGKRYLGGEVALFDILALWARTVPVAAAPAAAPDRRAAGLLALGYGLVGLGAAWRTRRALARLRRAETESRAQRLLFGAAVGLLGLHLLLPGFVWAFWVVAEVGVGALGDLVAWVERDRAASLLEAGAGA